MSELLTRGRAEALGWQFEAVVRDEVWDPPRHKQTASKHTNGTRLELIQKGRDEDSLMGGLLAQIQERERVIAERDNRKEAA